MLKLTKVFLILSVFIAFGYTSSAAPVMAAPEPPLRAVPKVISIFSDAYSPVAGTNFNPSWGQATVATTIDVATNPTLQYANLNYQGIEFYSDINAAGMTNLHLDVYTSDETSFKLYFIGRTVPTEKFVALPLTLNTWNSFDIPMTDFTSQGMSLSDLRQFKILGAGGNTVYIDNIYFFDSNATPDTEAPSNFTVVMGLITFSTIDLVLSATDNSNAVNFDITYGAKTITTGIASGKSKTITIKDLTSATAYNFSVVAKDGSGNVAANSPSVVAATTTAEPAAAPTPTRLASKVISIYSDAYTNVAANYNPTWGQATIFSFKALGGDPTLKYDNLNYQGTEFYSPVNVWAMDYMHVDVWTANETSLTIAPLSAGKETPVALTPLTLGGWKGFDIPLSSFTGVDMTALLQLKVVGSGGKTVFLDNIYFYNSSTTDDTEIPTAFTAVKGLETFNTIDLALKATDNSEKINFEITYDVNKIVNVYANSGVTKTITIKDLIPATAYSFSVVAKDASGNIAANSPIVVAATTTAEPSGAPTPTILASKVISIYSDAYTNVAANYNPNWGQATIFSLKALGGDPTLKYDNLNYQGTEFYAPLNVSAMNYMHVDVWTANETS